MSYTKSIKGETTMQKLLTIGAVAVAAAAIIAIYAYRATDPTTGHYRATQPVITMDTRTWLK